MAGASDDPFEHCDQLYDASFRYIFVIQNVEPFSNDIKVRVTQNVYYYPDVLVSCEENPEDSHFRNSPILIIEVTSPSTKSIDRREKLLFYQQIPSVQEYAVVDQHKINIELHRRQPSGTMDYILFRRV